MGPKGTKAGKKRTAEEPFQHGLYHDYMEEGWGTLGIALLLH
jgi:hypothetical protein